MTSIYFKIAIEIFNFAPLKSIGEAYYYVLRVCVREYIKNVNVLIVIVITITIKVYINYCENKFLIIYVVKFFRYILI